MRRFWLLLAAGDARSYGGHTGYADEVATTYQWDETVPFANEVAAGDVILLRDSDVLLGISVVDFIDRWDDHKIVLRCPVCGTPKIDARKTITPRYRCTRSSCHAEFEDPSVSAPLVRKYATRHGGAWLPLPGLMDKYELQALCQSPQTIQSMRPLVPSKVELALGPHIGRMLAMHGGTAGQGAAQSSTNSPPHPVRVRPADAATRQSLIDEHGTKCLFVGAAPIPTLDAVALSTFNDAGKSKSNGFALLRRDVRALVDLGQLTVEPSKLRIRVNGESRDYANYRNLDGEPLHVALTKRQRDWFALHWRMHSHLR